MADLEQYTLPPTPEDTTDTTRQLIIAEIQNYRGLVKIGAGDQVFVASNKGIQLGSGTFEDAPFSVDMEGNLVANSATITSFYDVGNGSDGAVVISGNTTLTRDYQYTSLTVDATFTLTTNGYAIKCQGTVTNNGTIDNSGGAGGSSSGTAGVAGAAGTLAGGGAGGRGGVTTENGVAGVATTSSKGGSAGAGGASGGGQTGGAAGTATQANAPVLQSGFLLETGATIASFTGGAGGGGGGSTSGAGTMYGGGGGGGGGWVDIACDELINNGVISAKGGAGGGGNTGGFPRAGGGGGGGGGAIRLAYRSTSGAGTTSVVGGAAGSGADGGSNGTAGSAGNVYTFLLA